MVLFDGFSFHPQDLSLLVFTPGTWKGLNKWRKPRGIKKVTIGKGCGGLRNATVGTQRSLASHCSSVQKPRTANRHRQESSEGHLFPGTKDNLPAGRPSDSICFSQTPAETTTSCSTLLPLQGKPVVTNPPHGVTRWVGLMLHPQTTDRLWGSNSPIQMGAGASQ